MWIHSAWSLVPGRAEELAVTLAERLFEGERSEIPGGLMFQRRDPFTERREDDGWLVGPDSGVETTALSALYLADPPAIGMDVSGDRTIVGIASPRPASNVVFVSRLAAQFDATALVPVLSKRHLVDVVGGGSVYEARTKRDEREKSVTYLNADHRGGDLDDWADETEFDGVTLTSANRLFTTFADGQLWIDGIPPQEMLWAVSFFGPRLWIASEAPDGLD
jgi:hypothetical protein